MPKNSFLKINLSGHSNQLLREDLEPSQIELSPEEKRKNWMHVTTHFLSIAVIGSFLFILLYQLISKPCATLTIPDYFISIVSMVVGFYFARSLFSNQK